MKAHLVGIAVAAAIVSVGCSQDSIPDRSAEVTVGDDTTSFVLDACGVDGDTLLILGQADDAVLQIAVGVTPVDDGFEAVDGEVGLSVDVGGVSLEAFTDTAWAVRGEDGLAPGEVTEVELRGSRLSVSASARSVAEPDELVEVSVDSRCDEDDVA